MAAGGTLGFFIGAPAVRPDLLAVRRVLDVVREAAGLKVADVHARLHRECLDSTERAPRVAGVHVLSPVRRHTVVAAVGGHFAAAHAGRADLGVGDGLHQVALDRIDVHAFWAEVPERRVVGAAMVSVPPVTERSFG